MIFCSQCENWYHLECIGLSKRDVPKKREKFLCKECKTEQTENVTLIKDVTMEDVNLYIEQLVREEEFNPNENESCRLAERGFTPLYTKNTAVQYFLDQMKGNGITYKVVDSGWGEFVLLPDEDLQSFFKIREEINLSNMTYACPPVIYFIGLKHINADSISKNVIKMPEDSLEEYKSWMEELKRSFTLT